MVDSSQGMGIGSLFGRNPEMRQSVDGFSVIPRVIEASQRGGVLHHAFDHVAAPRPPRAQNFW
eukprot:3429652-Rhodomonas_salina.1